MPITKSYRRFRGRSRKTMLSGGIRRGYRGTRYVPRAPMTTGRVKRIIDAEMKFRDLSVGPVTIPIVTGQMIHISGIDQGDSNTERNGNWIKPVSFMGTITVTGDAGSTDATADYRVGVLMWKENQAVDPAAIDKVFQDSGDPHQQFNVESKGQFKILWNRTGVVVNNNDNSQFIKMHRFYVKPNMKILFDDDDFRKYHLFLFGLSSVDVANSPPILNFASRIRYTDS